MAAIYSAFLSGLVSDNPLASGAATLNSTALANLPTVASPDYMWIVLDPAGTNGLPEMVKVTAHTASATSATIARGQQTSNGGNAAHAHIQNTLWVSAVTPEDQNPPQVDVFLASGTWTNPSWARQVQVHVLGCGGPGASGGRLAAGSGRGGSGAGGGGGYSSRTFMAKDLTATVAVTVPAAPVGGAAITADSTFGNAGTTAGSVSFGAYLSAGSGAAGGAGTAGGNGGTGGTGGVGIFVGGSGGAGGGFGSPGGAGFGAQSAGAGGGGGGSINASNTPFNGAASLALPPFNAVSSPGGTAPGGNGTAGSVTIANVPTPGAAGGGGAGGSTSSTGGSGGDGVGYGAGGGGGGASQNGFNSGAGGAGGPGICYVISSR